MNIYDMLMEKHREALQPIKERQKLNDERGRRRKEITHTLEVETARVNVLTRQIEDLLAKDESVEAGTLKQERQAVKSRVSELEAESGALIEEITREHAALEQARANLARRILSDNFPDIRALTVAKVKEAVDYLENVWAELQTYERDTAPCLSVSAHKERLAPSEIFTGPEEKRIAAAVSKWLA